ncbi:MAG: hypothetical protein LBL46_01560 [Rickettsiales bacterium]|jgi:cell division protein FtsB|nr:hypothetical protein [Rickettsiales bacterium]
MTKKIQAAMHISEIARNTWVVVAAAAGIVYWAAKQDSSLKDITKNEARIAALENRTTTLESGIGQLQLKINDIKEDLTLIKSAVIKK